MEPATMTLRAQSFRDGERIPQQHTAYGSDASVELAWSDVPAGTRSFVLTVEDPDAPEGTFVHYLRYDVPAGVHALRTVDGAPGRAGINDFGTTAWRGPAPEPDRGEHRYVFRLFALDVDSIGAPSGVRIDEVRQRMQGHVLGEATLHGNFGTHTAARQARSQWIVPVGIVVVFGAGAGLLVVLGIAGIFLAPLLAGIGVVLLTIWAWRRMSQQKPAMQPALGPRLERRAAGSGNVREGAVREGVRPPVVPPVSEAPERRPHRDAR